MKPTKTICPNCFSTDVRCQAWVNPNNHYFDAFTKDSLENGKCYVCDFVGELVCVDDNIQKIDKLYKEYIAEYNDEPRYVQCLVMYTDDMDSQDHVYIKLSSDFDEETDGDVFYFCNGVHDVKSLCDKGVEDFIIINTYSFENQIT